MGKLDYSRIVRIGFYRRDLLYAGEVLCPPLAPGLRLVLWSGPGRAGARIERRVTDPEAPGLASERRCGELLTLCFPLHRYELEINVIF